MLVLPVYDLLLLPGVTFYFKKDILDRMQVEKVEKGEEILFLIQKSEKRREDLTVDDFQNKGLVGTVEYPYTRSRGNFRCGTAER